MGGGSCQRGDRVAAGRTGVRSSRSSGDERLTEYPSALLLDEQVNCPVLLPVQRVELAVPLGRALDHLGRTRHLLPGHVERVLLLLVAPLALHHARVKLLERRLGGRALLEEPRGRGRRRLGQRTREPALVGVVGPRERRQRREHDRRTRDERRGEHAGRGRRDRTFGRESPSARVDRPGCGLGSEAGRA